MSALTLFKRLLRRRAPRPPAICHDGLPGCERGCKHSYCEALRAVDHGQYAVLLPGHEAGESVVYLRHGALTPQQAEYATHDEQRLRGAFAASFVRAERIHIQRRGQLT